MAKKISSSDLFEQEDLFKGVRDSATKTLAVFNELQSEIKATAIGLKNELSANTQASTAQLKQFTAISEEANKLMKQSVEIEKLKAQADQQRIKAEQEIVKLEKLKAQEQARANKEAEKAAKLAQSESSAYAKLSKQLRDAQKAYKDLAVTNQANTQEAKDLLQTITKLDKQLKEVDATVGQHQRNVGNYEGATRNLKLELRQLVRELQNMETTDPRFQEMTQRAGELKDQIQDTQAVVKATAGSAMENLAGSMANAGQIGVAAFQGVEASMALFGVESENIQKSLMRLTALMNLSQALETFGQLGDKITEMSAGLSAFSNKAMVAFNGLTKAGKLFAITGIGAIATGIAYLMGAFDDTTQSVSNYSKAQKMSNDIQNKAIESASEELSALDKLQKVINDETITRKEKNQAVAKLQEKYPELLKNVNAEKLSINELNKAVALNIKLAEARARINAAESLRAEKYQQILKEELVIQQYRQSIAKTTNENSIAMLNEQISRTQRVINGYKEEINQIDGITKADEALIAKVEEQTKVYETETPKVIKQVKERADYTRQLEKEKIDALEDGIEKRIKLLEFERDTELLGIDKNGKKAGELAKAIESKYQKEIDQVKKDGRDRSDRDADISLAKRPVKRLEIGKQEINAEEYVQSEITRLQNEAAEKALEKEKETWKQSKQFAEQTTEFFKKQSDERIALIDKEIEAAEKQADIFRELAANGNINAEQSLAEQERIIAESNRRKEREMKRQQRMELANTIYQTYAGHAAQDPKTALANTIRDASLLQAFISTLPMFYEGTEDTGAGGGVDGKGGFHAVLHPHERVIPKSLNDQIGNLTNEQLTQIAQQYRNGNLVRQDIAHSSMDLAILVNEMKDLKEVIRSKPETNIELGQITQSAMEIVQQSKRGNTVIYNRFKVRK